ncbi:MAG: dynamin family protein [Epsilonproteobacteria bacterium]|nr:MAG: dynamin family protein [Campylobacterota bacterium]
MTPKERYRKLKDYLSVENPVLLDVIDDYEALDKIAHKIGLLLPEETYTSHISWWPMISILGTFSSGKSTFINHYAGASVQDSGNQAVDDKFTVVCYGNNETPTTLPGLALDADPRFPFYNISEEINKVDPGEGNRANLYLQLKAIKSPNIKGKILIDSPGFDADSQRDGILRITSHIMEMSDLVLVFFDARHPEPGAMRDTLKHLVATTIGHKDANKILYILNQIDTTAKDDNLEEVIGSWQRALSGEGLISGNFYGIYNENAAIPFENEVQGARLKGKKDADLARITDRMDKVSIERAYRIIKALDDFARDIKEKKISLLHEALQNWVNKVLWTDATIIGLLIALLGILQVKFNLFDGLSSSQSSSLIGIFVAIILFFGIHFKVRSFFALRISKKWEAKDSAIAKAISHNTQWWKPIFTTRMRGLQKKNIAKLNELIAQSKRAIQKLNDQHVNSGTTAENGSKSQKNE